jgi:hypothetical protein
MKIPYEEFDLRGVRTYPLKDRKSKARVADFAEPYRPGSGVAGLIDSLPGILSGADFKAVVEALVDARRRDAAIVWGLGAHVLKTGLSPVVIDLMERGFVSAIATNGAGIIHDFEIALAGATSEEVEETLGPGQFGMAEETGALLNEAITDGVGAGFGLGQSVGRFLSGRHPEFERHSVAAAAWRFSLFHFGGVPFEERRLHQLRFRGDPAGGVPEGDRDCAQYRPRSVRTDNDQHRLSPSVSRHHQRRDASDGRHRPRVLVYGASRDSDSAARRGARGE